MANTEHMSDEEAMIEGLREAASGAQKLSESIDILLTALVRIAAGVGGAPTQVAEDAIRLLGRHRGQSLSTRDRNAILATARRSENAENAEQLHALRAAGSAPPPGAQ